eukprot:652265-Pyramimonas_sp.AAC.1
MSMVQRCVTCDGFVGLLQPSPQCVHVSPLEMSRVRASRLVRARTTEHAVLTRWRDLPQAAAYYIIDVYT